ncbi:MAG: hypothetical protein A3F67_05605 [Verrucomicrobia bacterium RIFCSPHIGHO2_12_FULL_41_10]|nr:MAG: hypothetical protein A3F67_05605 [Verrucomicrobia bacterium RIFCSPHIGHO2_12_FULL_41_10]HLB32729.1 hypothetical protein [Chthoniobacterales bacterium]
MKHYLSLFIALIYCSALSCNAFSSQTAAPDPSSLVLNQASLHYNSPDCISTTDHQSDDDLTEEHHYATFLNAVAPQEELADNDELTTDLTQSKGNPKEPPTLSTDTKSTENRTPSLEKTHDSSNTPQNTSFDTQKKSNAADILLAKELAGGVAYTIVVASLYTTAYIAPQTALVLGAIKIIGLAYCLSVWWTS